MEVEGYIFSVTCRFFHADSRNDFAYYHWREFDQDVQKRV